MLQWISKNYSSILKSATTLALILVAAFLLFDFVAPAWAQSIADPSSTLQEGVTIIKEPLGLTGLDIRLVVSQIIRAALGLMGIVLVIMIIYAGILWMTAGGNDEQITKSKSILKNAVIGLAIVLLAYSIVLLVMRILGIGGFDNSQTRVTPPGAQNFRGSGALGGILKDHYPGRDEIGVHINTKIIITFRQPVNPASFTEDRNGDGIWGNCRASATVDWLNDCDRLKKDDNGGLNDRFINIKRSDTGASIPDAVILAVTSTPPDSPTGVYNLVIKPLVDLTTVDGGYLEKSVGYTVHLGDAITLDLPGNDPAFTPATAGDNYYEWSFVTGNDLDLGPPTVLSVVPKKNSVGPKNSVIQINFNEPMNPIGIQGSFSNTGLGYYALSGNNVFLKNNRSTMPAGNFVLTNNYQTLEFTPSTQCAVNACGQPIYCLPVCDNSELPCSASNYELLLRTALAKGAPGSRDFQALPFSGFMDLADNALDGDADGQVDQTDNSVTFSAASVLPDNYDWKFILNNDIDRTSPILSRVSPGLDGTFVSANEPLTMEFSKSIRGESLYDIKIDQTPPDPIPLCFAPYARYLDSGATRVDLRHCPFLDSARNDYYPYIDSTVEDVNFNCFYPGRGPKIKAVSRVSPACTNSANCCAVVENSNPFCCNGNAIVGVTTTAACEAAIQGGSAAANP